MPTANTPATNDARIIFRISVSLSRTVATEDTGDSEKFFYDACLPVSGLAFRKVFSVSSVPSVANLYSAAAVVAGTVLRSYADVLSPNDVISSRPSICSMPSITLAIGVPSAALMCRLPLN